MTTRKKTGECEVCGGLGKALRLAGDLQTCSMCNNLVINVKKRPQLVVQTLQKLHGDKYLQSGGEYAAILTEVCGLLDCGRLKDAPAAVRQLLEVERKLKQCEAENSGWDNLLVTIQQLFPDAVTWTELSSKIQTVQAQATAYQADAEQLKSIAALLADHYGPDVDPAAAVKKLMESKISEINGEEITFDLGHELFNPAGTMGAPLPGPTNWQIGGNHYVDLPIGPTEYSQRNSLGCCESAVVKYVTRHKRKGGLEDIKKAIHYLQLLEEIEYQAEAVKAEVAA